ncbi:MAG: hypothetical protein ACR2NA_08545 [Solirubrobacterales bacterium]
MASTADLVAQAVTQFQERLPALRNLKLIFGLDLRGRGDLQQFRVELPGPRVTRGAAADGRVTVMMPRATFNDLADGSIAAYRRAWEHGDIKVEGDPRVQKLVASVIERHEARTKMRKAR